MRSDGEHRQRGSSAQRTSDYERLLLVKELEWLRTLAHVIPCGIYRVDASGRIVYVNEHWSEVTGYPVNVAIGQSWAVAVHPDDLHRMQTEWQRCLHERVPYRVEHRFIQPNGRIVWALTQTVREVDGRGRTTGYTGVTSDITELRGMRDELQLSQRALEERMKARSGELQRMARIVESVDDAVLSCDLEARVLSWNQAAERIFGYTAHEMLGQSAFLLAARGREAEARDVEAAMRSGTEVRRRDLVLVGKAGELIEIAFSGFPLRDERGEITGTFAIMRDITAYKQAERRLQRLSWKLMQVQDEERRRIARELHDSTAQALAALSMSLSALARENPPVSDERRRQLLQDSLMLAEQATSELRSTSYLLHPPLLDERGLQSALHWFCDGFAQRSGVKMLVDVAEIPRLPHDVETALFRVAQEGLHNVLRHSGSDSAELKLRLAAGEVRLEVRDRGRGMPASLDHVGVGVAGMRERLLQLKGTLEIEQAHPGTRVIARVPLI